MDTFYDGTKIIKKEEIDAFFKKKWGLYWKNHFSLFYFIEFLYLCHEFHILYPRCSQGVAKVYPSSKG